jgi:HSP20 family protein
MRLAGDPFLALERLQRALDRAIESPSPVWTTGFSGRVFPPVNIFSDENSARIRVEVPGLAAEDFSIETQGNTLTIKGERSPASAEKGQPHRRERWSGGFSRSFQLPQDLELDRAEASYARGILSLRIPKKEETKPRRLAVRSS